ncbi:MAG: hypothetical protein Pg6C_16870 [Treponemataceae bacterium]|nr:MAG: hypothetical protein Pg6C_16870 [Treponemataceae bacterium]
MVTQRINHLSRGLYKKAYLIEFMNEEGTEAEEAFTFSVPPESEELSYPQRKTETKTFGGLHVDDYGIDAVKISLSGSTVNQELKLIYNPKSPLGEYKTGEEEIYMLRDMIKRWKSGGYLKRNHEQKVIMLYDLSKMSKRCGELIPNYWRVFPGELKIRRSSEKPFTYKYSIEFTGVDLETGSKRFEEAQETAGKLNAIEKVLDSMKKALYGLYDMQDVIDDTLQKIGNFKNQMNDMNNMINNGVSAFTETMNSVADTAAGLVDGVTSVVDGIHTVVSLPRTVQLAAVNIGLELYNAAKDLARETAALVDECRKMFDPGSGYWDIPQETLDQFEMTSTEFKDAIAVMCDDMENTANETVAGAKSAAVPTVSTGVPDPATGAQRLVLSYGDSLVTLKQTDTLESLAAQYYGNADNAADIAAYNRVASIDELSPGDTIRIPVLTKAQRNISNRIYARPEDRDNYGRDIALTDEGGILASPSGDYRLTGGVDNLSQAILLRLRERVNKRIRINAYGIRTNISDPNAGVAYILSSIDLTMRSDPRVKAVKNIGFTGQGDSLNVTVDYTDINNAGGTVRGRA